MPSWGGIGFAVHWRVLEGDSHVYGGVVGHLFQWEGHWGRPLHAVVSLALVLSVI